MFDFEQMLKRVHVQQLRSFFIDGVDLDNWYESEDNRPYEQRRQEEERSIWELLEKTFPDGAALDEAAGKLSRALVVNQSVFMEIGIRAGAILMFELLRENPGGGSRNRKPNEEGEL